RPPDRMSKNYPPGNFYSLETPGMGSNLAVKVRYTLGIRASLPFPLTAGHYDNGMEFINKPLLGRCLAKHIKATRSRPCRKNENCLRTSGPSGAEELRCGAQDGGVFPV
ncbi:MAG: hypothetical protein LBE17_02675, partial [Treponema sp.]|nr:hypothetical protein [Treponema sp.]